MLFVFLIICHFLADYSDLQSDWMVDGKKNLKLLPLFAHSAVHASLMLIPLLIWCPVYLALMLGALQFGAHFGIDFSKGLVYLKFPQLETGKWKWYIEGGDQLAHVLIVFLMYTMAIA